MDAMILSAGLGMRMRPLTDRTPKALLKVGPHRLIEYHLLNLACAGISNVVINTSYIADMFEEVLGSGEEHGVQITYSHEGDTPLDTGGGILNALPLIRSDPFLVVNADVWTDISFEEIQIRDDYDGCLVVVDNPSHHPKGDFRLVDDQVKLPDVTGEARTFTYSGIAVLRKCILENLPISAVPLYQIFRNSISIDRLAGQYHEGSWFDIGTPERLRLLDLKLSSGQKA